MGNCNPDPCNQNGPTGEVCDSGTGKCNCGNDPCGDGEICNNGVCEGMYYN